MTQLEKSRALSKIDVPEPKGLSGRFVYNFFVSNEGTVEENPSYPDYTGVVSASKLKHYMTGSKHQADMPRYVTLEWKSATVASAGESTSDENTEYYMDALKAGGLKLANSENSVSVAGETIVNENDKNYHFRVRGLLNQLKNLCSESEEDSVQLSSLTEVLPTISPTLIKEILSPGSQEGVQHVNSLGEKFKPEIYHKYVKTPLKYVIDNRFWSPSAVNYRNNISPMNTAYTTAIKYSNITFNGLQPLVPLNLRVLEMESDTGPNEVHTAVIGYVIERHRITRDKNGVLEKSQKKIYYVTGASSNRFVDTKVIYGAKYTYTIRNVVLFEATIPVVEQVGTTVSPYRIKSLLLSSKSAPLEIETVETIPPEAPDGVLYRFDYNNNKGLVITWQFPVGRQKDTKYFQIFRRKTIHEPFTCIAQIDFNDAEKKTPLTESVYAENIILKKYPTNTYRDIEFSRTESDFIYAVAAIDAHGLTSGYSVQTLVGFNQRKNKLSLKRISPAGAPKQYPNFFIDPSLDENIFVDTLTQDSMSVSHKKKGVKIYFDPDAIKYYISQNSGQTTQFEEGDVVQFGFTKGNYRPNCKYVFSFLNIDRQKSQSISISIRDTTIDTSETSGLLDQTFLQAT